MTAPADVEALVERLRHPGCVDANCVKCRAADLLLRIAEENRRLREDNKSLQATFDLRWDADMRAIKKWQAAGDGRELTWPDHADLCVWLMEQLDLQGPRSDAG